MAGGAGPQCARRSSPVKRGDPCTD
jgi:hypothetical protein